MSEPWWRDSVVYQVYPRSFADSDGDGVGDLTGVTEHLPYLAALGVDALWLCPFYPSPQVDAGYDVSDYCDVDPLFGTLADAERLVATAHGHGLRVLVDLVPNHCSDRHPWFVEAVAAGRGSPARERFHFVEGRGPDGDQPPNNWVSVFGGPSWTQVSEPDGSPGQWYYHLFAPEQPDFDWSHPDVAAEFERVLRFWLDRGVDGFRIDVSDALIKDTAWPDTPDGSPVIPKDADSPVHDVYRRFRAVMDSYDGDRAAVIETGAPDEVVALFLRADEMHLAFGFRFTAASWRAAELRAAIDGSLAADAAVGAPSTWVTDNHDTPRSVSRYAADVQLAGPYVPAVDTTAAPRDTALGLRRARAMAVLLLSLPGAAFVYAGQELGLPNVDDLPDDVLQDPVWFRSGGTVRGRDGCRVPLPWEGTEPPYGFSASPTTWLPQPAGWADLTVAAQETDPHSTLHLYRQLLGLRHDEPAMRRGTLRWLDSPPDVLACERRYDEHRLVVVVNLGSEDVPLPAGEVLARSDPARTDGVVAADCAAVVRPA